MVKDKPVFPEVAGELIQFIGESDLVIHNAEFDLGFLEAELDGTEYENTYFKAWCTLESARDIWEWPAKNKLDAVCDRLGIDRSRRDKEGHGALLDAELAARVFIAMTGEGDSLFTGMSGVIFWIAVIVFIVWLLN